MMTTTQTRQLSKAQANVLAALRQLPARFRVNCRAGGTIRMEVLDSYDGRTIRSLVGRGFITFSERGFQVAA